MIKFASQKKDIMENNRLHLTLILILAMFGSFLISGCGDKDDDAIAEACSIDCQNGGILTINCQCSCPPGFEGDLCEIEICTIVCENGGEVTPQCECDCPDGFTGTNCEICTPKVGYFDRDSYWSPAGTNYVDNVQATLPASYILTGCGFSTASTIMIAGRELLQDGTLGEEVQFRAGNNPNGSLDVSYIVPDGTVITGVGFGLNATSGVGRLVINYSEITFNEACDLELGPPMLYDNNSSFGIDAWLKISDISLDSRYHGFRSLEIKYTGPQQVEALIGEIINQF